MKRQMTFKIFILGLLLSSNSVFSQGNTNKTIQKKQQMIFSIRYSQGKNYDLNKSVYQQDLLEHGRYMKKLSEEGKLLLAGPFTDNSGAEIILKVEDENEAKNILSEDPAIIKNIFTYAIKTWDIKFNSLNIN